MLSNTYYFLGLYSIRKKSWKSAEKLFLKAISHNKAPPSLWYYRLGFALGKQKRWIEAEKLLRKAVDLAPDNLKFKIRLGMSLEKIGKKTEAEDLYKSILDKNLNHNEYYRIGKIFFSFSRWKFAEAAFRAAVNIENKKAIYHVLLADSLKKQNKNWQVIEFLQIATQLDNKHVEWFVELGSELYLFKRYTEAAQAYKAALQLQPNETTWHYKYGLMLEKAGRYPESVNAYNLAISHDKKLNSKRFGIGVFHQNNGLWLDAAQAYKALSETSLDAGLYYKTGYAYAQCHLWDDAVNAFLSAILLEKGNAEYYYYLGYAYERKEMFEEAVQAYERAITTRKKDTSDWYYRLGFVLNKIGQYELACKYFLRTKKNEYKYYLNTTKKNTSNELFLQNLQKKIKATPLNIHLYHTLSILYENAGCTQEAADIMNKIILHSNKHEENMYYRLGFLLAKIGKYKEASTAFCNMRIFKIPYSAEIFPYIENIKLRPILQYNEFRKTLPIREKTILYESFNGNSISCNPYAIFRGLIVDKNFSDWTHVLVLDNLGKLADQYKIYNNIVICQKGSDSYINFLATASHLINNSTFPNYFTRRTEQKYLNTWHGTPLKTLGSSMKERFMEHKNGTRNFLQATHLISPNAHTTKVTLNDFAIDGIFSGKIAECGYPRVDLTLKVTTEQKHLLRQTLGITNDKPVLFYAPTWRGTHNDISFDKEKLLNDLEKLSELNYNIIFRGHALLADIIDDLSPSVFIPPVTIDTNEILSITDILLTDYSSVFFDFMKTGKPIIFYCYDREKYEEKRGLYFQMEGMPGKCIENIDDLCILLGKPITEIYIPLTENNAEFCRHDDGNATERVIQFFFYGNDNETIDTNNNKENILIFGGPFMPNGITSSLINLLTSIDLDKNPVHLVVEPSSIENFQERRELFEKLPNGIKIIPRVGLMNTDIDDKYIIDMVHRLNSFPSPLIKEKYINAHKNEFQRMFGKSNFHSVINFEGYHKFWASLLASTNFSNKLIYLHNEMFSEWKLKFPYLEIIFNTYSYYDKLASVSPTLSDINKKELKLFEPREEKFIALPNVVNEVAIKEKANTPLDPDIENWIDASSTLFITMGRLSPEKDQKKLILAFAKTFEKHKNIQLLILGDGPLKDELTFLTRKLQLDDRIKFGGIRFNPFPALKRAHCFVLSSNHEGQPMTLLEALILKKQIIATNIPGNRGVLDEHGGIIVENNTESLAIAMENFIQGKRKTIHFSPQRYCKKALENFYSALKK